MELDRDDIQGNIVPGFNKDHQVFVLVRFSSADAGRKWLTALQPEIASAQEVDAFRTAFRSMKDRRPPDPAHRDGGSLRALSAIWTNVALSFAGLGLLTRAQSGGAYPQSFRSNRVPGADPTVVTGEVHAVLIVATDQPLDLAPELDRQRQRMVAYGVTEVTTFCGDTLPGDLRGHEHFGFKDGISQPKIAGTEWGCGADVAPGEFILGVPDQTGKPSGEGLPAWTRNGSFLAFVQLQQHVGTFWNTMRQYARELGADPDDVAAWIVGRKKDANGTPLAKPPARLSHIGRGYSRWLPANEALRHRILRRGIPYGPVWIEGASDGDAADNQRGLLFVSYQADLERQFEFVWYQWLNASEFPVPAAGRDALVGQVRWPQSAPSPSAPFGKRSAAVSRPDPRGGIVSLSLPAFVTPRYGAYFFAPAIDALARLADGSLGPQSTR